MALAGAGGGDSAGKMNERDGMIGGNGSGESVRWKAFSLTLTGLVNGLDNGLLVTIDSLRFPLSLFCGEKGLNVDSGAVGSTTRDLDRRTDGRCRSDRGGVEGGLDDRYTLLVLVEATEAGFAVAAFDSCLYSLYFCAWRRSGKMFCELAGY